MQKQQYRLCVNPYRPTVSARDEVAGADRLPMVASVVLAGGRSARMGFPKALLPFGENSLLGVIVEKLVQFTSPVVVAASRPEQVLPQLHPAATVVFDEKPHRSPLFGFQAGLRALAGRCSQVYLTGCDMPFVSREVVRQMSDKMGQWDAVMPSLHGVRLGLGAVYRIGVLKTVDDLIERDVPSILEFAKTLRSLAIDVSAIVGDDESVSFLDNLNTPKDYATAVSAAAVRYVA